MANIIFRQSTTADIPSSITAKGAPLTNLELDGNFRSLNDNKIELTASINIGTTSVALDRASGSQTLNGVSIDGNAGTVTNGIYTTSSINIGTTSVTLNRASGSQTLTGISIDGNAGTVTNGIYTTSSINIGTTSVALNRASGSQTLSGVSIEGNAGTVTDGVYTSTTNILTGSNTFRNASGIRVQQASTQDSVIVQGRAGGVGNFSVTLIPTTLSDNRTLTLPDASGTLIYDGGSYINPGWIASLSETKVLPSQTGNSGKYLTTDGTSTSWATVTGGASNLDALTDVVITTPSTGQVLKFDGTNWVNGTDATSAGGSGITTGKAIAMAIVFGG